MGNLRTIKKDVEFFICELIDDCLIYLELNNNKNEEKVGEIIGAALDLQDELIDKINHPQKEIKARVYYKAIEKELFEGVDALYEQLSSLSN